MLLISLLFILLAARIDFDQLLLLGWQPILILLVIQLIARPLKVFLCTLGTDFTWQEKSLLAWIAPRGIVAAAISAIFAERLIELGYEDATLLVPLTFWIIIGTVILQSATAKPLAILLGVTEPARDGFLIIGANAAARQIALSIQSTGLRVVVCDTNWDNISQARMAGLETYYGNPVSEHADRYLDLSGLGALLVISPYRDVNAVAAVHFRTVFGAHRIYGVSTQENSANAKFQITEDYAGARLFSEALTYSKLASLASKGHVIKITSLSETFNWDDYQAQNNGEPLFYSINDQKLKPWLPSADLKPEAGWKIYALTAPEPFDNEQPESIPA